MLARFQPRQRRLDRRLAPTPDRPPAAASRKTAHRHIQSERHSATCQPLSPKRPCLSTACGLSNPAPPPYLDAATAKDRPLALFGITDGIARGLEGLQSGVSEMFFEPTLRLGVTGLARSGKTVFITALIANLLARGRMPQLSAARDGRIETVHLQPQPDVTLPRFDYEAHLTDLTGDTPHWPDSTRAISELRLSFITRPGAGSAGLRGPQTLHLDIVDYPGEWLLGSGADGEIL